MSDIQASQRNSKEISNEQQSLQGSAHRLYFGPPETTYSILKNDFKMPTHMLRVFFSAAHLSSYRHQRLALSARAGMKSQQSLLLNALFFSYRVKVASGTRVWTMRSRLRVRNPRPSRPSAAYPSDDGLKLQI